MLEAKGIAVRVIGEVKQPEARRVRDAEAPASKRQRMLPD
jgi:hypothetical protein